ncbi:PREDICTED: kelch-like protein 28 [Gekko japonicus]|uniref:Kelch-like protein 28 n=1 Tax=Gekko japonicus TaxID=146911 RepID=A0ABM1L855_GEKJA|nr:PREDICTED: kelch-like protein 28 [Gekko japonicus]
MDQPSPTYMIANLAPLHSEQLLQGLNLLRQHHELCDIILRVGDVKIHAHKVVLASISPYFKAMFGGNLSEKENSEVEFQCIAEAALQAIVEYAYTGTVFISQDTVESLLPAANLLQIKLVLKECCTFLESQLDPGNCIGISRFAETYGCHDLYLAANKYICQNFEDVCQTEEFFELTHSELDEIVSNDCLNVVTEESVFYALESWIKYDVQERQKYLAQLLHCVRLPLLSVKFLTRLYEANHLIRDDHTCKHLLNEALKYHFMPEHRLSYQTVLTSRPRCPPKVLCAVGGKAGLFACLESVEMYFPQNDSWIGLAPLRVPRYEFGICVLDQKIYVMGGIAAPTCQGVDYNKHERSVECWDPDTNTWAPLESMNEGRSTLGVAVLAREIYALGGYDGQSYLQSVEKYIPRVKEWQPVAPMSKTRSCFSAAVLDGMIYAIGGYGPAHMNSVERYDPSRDSWETVAPMADKRINFGVGVTLGFIFVVGGHNGVSHLSSIERYDPHQNQWTVCRPMKEPRTGVGAAVIDTYLYVVGGHSGSSYLNTVQKYDPISDAWLDTAGMMHCRCNFGLTAL